MNSSGKVLVVFSVIIAILLLSLTAISIFLFQKEIEKRQLTEVVLEESKDKEIKLEDGLAKIKREKFLLEEKNKEFDEQINSLLDELELQEGLTKELKGENLLLKGRIEKIIKEKDLFEAQLAGVDSLKEKIGELRTTLKSEADAKNELEKKIKVVEASKKELKAEIAKLKEISAPALAQHENDSDKEKNVEENKAGVVKKEETEKIELKEIVVTPGKAMEGRIISVDKETEFVIINLGKKDGVKIGKIMSVYRGKDYLGDIKVTRLQPEMSAADLLPPFSSRLVRKNDRVVVQK